MNQPRGSHRLGRILDRLGAELELQIALMLAIVVIVSLWVGRPEADFRPEAGSGWAHFFGTDINGVDNLHRHVVAIKGSVLGPAIGAALASVTGALLGAILALWRGPAEWSVTRARALTDVLPRVLLFILVTARVPGFDGRIPLFVVLAPVLVPSVALSVRNVVFAVFTRAQVRGLLAQAIPSHELVLKDILWRGCRWSMVDIALARFVELVALETVLSYFGLLGGVRSLGWIINHGIGGNYMALVLLFAVVYLPLRIGTRVEAAGRRAQLQTDG